MSTQAPLEQPAAPRGEAIHQPAEFPSATVDQLLAARSDYHSERTWHKFLLDAYAGTGGFQGKVRQPFSSYWGWASDIYGGSLVGLEGASLTEGSIETYLDRFDREDLPKFIRRANAAHYPNYVAALIDVPVSFMFRKRFTAKPDASETGDALAQWLEDADGAGTSWSDMIRDTIVPRVAVLGWTPVLFDMPSTGTRLPTALDDQKARNRPYAIPLFPSNLLDWKHDDAGILEWAKVRTDYTERAHPLDPGRDITRITLWFRDRWEWFEITKAEGGKPFVRAQAEGSHPFNRVPIAVMRRKPVPDDRVRGIPFAGSASEEARRLFNYLSELDEHLRSCAFAFLQVPTESPSQGGSLVAGNGNALPVHPEWQREYRWVSPDPSVSEMYERRIANTVEEMYRVHRMEFTRGVKGGQARSGVSQSFEFESANRTIADFARMVASFDTECRRLVASVLPGAPPASAIHVTAPSRFDVEEMAKELDEALAGVQLGPGPRAVAEIKKKVIRQLLPQLDAETMVEIENQIDDIAELDGRDLRDLMAADSVEAREALRRRMEGEAPEEPDEDEDES